MNRHNEGIFKIETSESVQLNVTGNSETRNWAQVSYIVDRMFCVLSGALLFSIFTWTAVKYSGHIKLHLQHTH